MTEAQIIGKFAENKSAEYLISIGWIIIARNILNEFGELDIIAIDKKLNELVIIEVRARTLGKIISPLESIGPRKLRTLIRSARLFIEENGWGGFWRVDVIGITFKDKIKISELENNNNWTLEHVRNITEGLNIFS